MKQIERLASQLLGDLEMVDAMVQLDYRHAASQQKLQLILDAFERVGEVALDQQRCSLCSELYPAPVALHHTAAECFTNRGVRIPTEVDKMRDNLI